MKKNMWIVSGIIISSSLLLTAKSWANNQIQTENSDVNLISPQKDSNSNIDKSEIIEQHENTKKSENKENLDKASQVDEYSVEKEKNNLIVKNQTKKIPAIQSLIQASAFKVCSLGHNNHNIDEFEFQRKQLISGDQSVIKYSADKNNKFKCEISYSEGSKETMNLSCWKGVKKSISVSSFSLGYIYKTGFLFINKSSGKLVVLQPEIDNKISKCDYEMKPVAAQEKTIIPVDEVGPGLADLTF